MRFHILGLHHTIPNNAFSACAFTGKVMRLPAVLSRISIDRLGMSPTMFLYANGVDIEGIQPPFSMHRVLMRARSELDARFGGDIEKDYWKNCGDAASIRDFEEQLRTEIAQRIQPGDFILHTIGDYHAGLVKTFPQAIHVESGIGYMSGGFGAYRIFESEAWRHWHFGRHHDADKGALDAFKNGYTGGPYDPANTFVVPNYYDPEEWPCGDGSGGYVLFAGRNIAAKGIAEVYEIARRLPEQKFKIAGGAEDGLGAILRGFNIPNIELVGTVNGTARAELYGNAMCMAMPTRYVEPFGGSGAEAMLCGTPLLASAWGAFTERPCTQCRTIDDYVETIQGLRQMDYCVYQEERWAIAAWANRYYSYEACARLYDDAFTHIAGLK